jgi:hypothetical protein
MLIYTTAYLSHSIPYPAYTVVGGFSFKFRFRVRALFSLLVLQCYPYLRCAVQQRRGVFVFAWAKVYCLYRTGYLCAALLMLTLTIQHHRDVNECRIITSLLL